MEFVQATLKILRRILMKEKYIQKVTDRYCVYYVICINRGSEQLMKMTISVKRERQALHEFEVW